VCSDTNTVDVNVGTPGEGGSVVFASDTGFTGAGNILLKLAPGWTPGPGEKDNLPAYVSFQVEGARATGSLGFRQSSDYVGIAQRCNETSPYLNVVDNDYQTLTCASGEKLVGVQASE
jgi:hypothetical protein